MVLFVVYSVYNSEKAEAQFSAIASGLFILPFFVLSALSGQLADMRDKAKIIRWVKLAEIFIMTIGAAGLVLAWLGILTHALAIPLMLLALFAMGVHSTFFGPIKYAILPQHLEKNEVLAGTGLVEAGTYIAILFGTILAGWIPVEVAAAGVMVTAVIGYIVSLQIPPAAAANPGRAARLPHHPRLDPPGARHDAPAAGVLRDPRDQLLLDHRRGAVHPVHAAGQERAATRRRKWRACSW